MQCQFYRHFIPLFWEFHLNIFRLHFPGSHNWAFSFSSALLSFWRPCGTEKNHTKLWWAHSLQTWKNIYWHFILSARCWLATMSRCLLHVVNLLVVLYLRWWCGLWKLVWIWICLLQVFIVHGLCHVANLLYCLRLPEPRSTKAEPPSVGKLLSLAHFRWGGTFQSNFQKNVWKYLGYFCRKI